jgi:hypothetical protein
LNDIEDVSYNVPYIAKNYTYTIVTMHSTVHGRTVTFSFTTLMPASLGAVFATSVLPVDVQIPPVAAPNKTAPVVGPIGGSNTTPIGGSNTTADLPYQELLANCETNITACLLYQELLSNSRYMQSYLVNYGG